MHCGKILNQSDGLCLECFAQINFISSPYCQQCGRPFANAQTSKKLICGHCLKDKRNPFRMIRSAFTYDDFSKKLILDFKFYDRTDNAKSLAKWLKLSSKDMLEAGVDLIVPVPLHYTRLIKRRYNQSALLASALGKMTGVEVDCLSVVKHKNTKPQVEFSGRARVQNVKKAFSVKNLSAIKGKRILLVDDVYTTGSTLRECARAIKAAGALSVDGVTIARVI